mmetsp:Transcript_16041/g.31368  ORF Transcript_16041/g.31368 Transcript_16041/m.31368 type:complete len:204 (+) Transcript_16041:114-725(+)
MPRKDCKSQTRHPRTRSRSRQPMRTRNSRGRRPRKPPFRCQRSRRGARRKSFSSSSSSSSNSARSSPSIGTSSSGRGSVDNTGGGFSERPLAQPVASGEAAALPALPKMWITSAPKLWIPPPTASAGEQLPPKVEPIAMTGAALARARGGPQPNHGFTCVDFSLGRCRRGDLCRYVHPPSPMLWSSPHAMAVATSTLVAGPSH